MDLLILFSLVGATFAGALVIMIGCWLLFLWKDNLGFADVGWAPAFLVSGLALFMFGVAPLSLKSTLVAMILLWSGRLTWHLLRRFRFNQEDPRYQELRSQWINCGGLVSSRALGLYLVQAVLITLLALPFYLVGAQYTLEWGWMPFFAILLWALAFYGEIVADQQLYQFKYHPENDQQVCDVGLWRYSRHPNYFFEWLIWMAFALFAWPTDWGLFAFASPLLMLYLLTRVSGIPQAETQALKTKGEAYRLYQQKTSAFVPWFPG